MAGACIKQSASTLAAPKVGCQSSPELWSSPRSLICPGLHASRPSQGWANGVGFLSGKVLPGKHTVRKHVAQPTSTPARQAGKCRAVLATDTAPASTTTRASDADKPVETKQLTFITGTEGDAGIFGYAKVTFVSRTGEAYPKVGGLRIDGPFAANSRKPPVDLKLPKDFEVAGIIIQNPEEDRLDIRFLGWLAERLDFQLPVINKNLLDLLTKIPLFKRLSDQDWYINQLELVGGNEKQVFPLYGWVQEASVRVAFDGRSFLPQDTPEGLTQWRRKSLIVNQNAYNFQPYNDLSKPPNNDNYMSPGFRPTLDPYPLHLLTPRTDKTDRESKGIPRDERFALSKSETFVRGTVQGGINLLWALLNNGRTGPILAASVGGAVLVGYLTTNLIAQFVPSDVLVSTLHLTDSVLPPFAQRLALSVADKIPVARTAGILAGLSFGTSLFKYQIPRLTFNTVEGYANACFKRSFKLGPFSIGYQLPWVYNVGKQYPDKAWNTDFMFGWQTVAGINPESITLVHDVHKQLLGKGSTITEQDLRKVKEEVPTFDRDVKDKRIFMLDFSVLEGYMPKFNEGAGKKEGKHLYAPVVLLRQTNDENYGVPVPIAIKLSKDAQEIITPGSDSSKGKWGWTLAKAIANSANSGVHQLAQHWLRTHAVCETYSLGMRRRLSEVHPLFKLLIPHTRYTMDINNKARSSLINADGVIEKNFSPGPDALQVSAAAYRGWRFANENPVTDLENRGVLDKNVLPNYPYRAHALEVWKALTEYVREYVDLFYETPKDIEEDYELQAFWEEVKRAHNSLDTWLKIPANCPDGKATGLPWPHLETKDDLVKILATMMWAGSFMHSVVNFGQYDYSAWVPAGPASVRGEFDYQKLRAGAYTEGDFMAAMPTALQMQTVMTVVEALVIHAGDEQYIGQKSETAPDGVYPRELRADPWFVDDDASEVYNNFINKIERAQKKLEQMNEEAEAAGTLPYYYLLPHKNKGDERRNIPPQGVPNSVTI